MEGKIKGLLTVSGANGEKTSVKTMFAEEAGTISRDVDDSALARGNGDAPADDAITLRYSGRKGT